MKRLWGTFLALAVVVALAYAYWPREPNDDSAWDAPDTSYSPGPQGTKALYLLFQQLGLPVTRLRRPSYDRLDPGATLWNLSGSPLGAVERRWLLDFVRGGGTFVGGFGPEEKLFAEAGLGEPEFRDHETGLASKDGLTVEAERFRSVSGLAAAERVDLVSAQGDPVAASWRVGKGSLVFLGLTDIARDDQIGKSDNGVFLAHLALAGGGGGQVFDEFSTGFGDLGLAALLAKAPYRWGLLQAAAALLVLLWGLGLRRAPAEPLARIRRRQTADHVDAVARLWAEAGDAGLPLDSLLRAADDRARARLGLASRTEGASDFVAWVEAVRPELGGRALEVWGRATALAELRRPSLGRVREAAAALAKLEREAMAW